MQRKLVKSAVVIALEILIATLKWPTWLTVLCIGIGVLYLVYTWDGLPDFVAKHQEDDRLTTLGSVQPPSQSVERSAEQKAVGTWGQPLRQQAPSMPPTYEERLDAVLDEAEKPPQHQAPGALAPDPKLKINVRLVINTGTPGLHIQATNLDKDTVQNAKFIITDIRMWEMNDWVTTQDVHGSGTTFAGMVTGNATLHPGVDKWQKMGFINAENEHRLDVLSPSQGHCRLTESGIRRVSYRITSMSGVSVDGAICLRWDGPGAKPEPCSCPPCSTVPAAPIVSAAPAPHKPVGWR